MYEDCDLCESRFIINYTNEKTHESASVNDVAQSLSDGARQVPPLGVRLFEFWWMAKKS